MWHKHWLAESTVDTGRANLARKAGAAAHHPAVAELVMRVIGAVLQILATWALVHTLNPQAAGVYFRGFVIACGTAALIRGKYELYMAHYLIGRRAMVTGIGDGVLLFQLGLRVLVRASLVCGALLVVTADLDIQAPRLQPALETYLPFVLAIPCVSLSTFIGEALRAANRTLLGTVIAAYSLNTSILLAAALAPSDAPLSLYAWAFLGGSLLASALAAALGRRAFAARMEWGARPIAREVLQETDQRELIALGRGVLLWGPLCILAVVAPAEQMAQYAVAARTALVVDFFLPALNLAGGRDLIRRTLPFQASRDLLRAQLGGALFYSSVFVGALLIAGHATLALFGHPYDTEFVAYALLLGVQWANGIGRPAIRDAVAEWDEPRIRAWVCSGALATVSLGFLAVNRYGAVAAAAASLVGMVIVNGRAVTRALSRSTAAKQ